MKKIYFLRHAHATDKTLYKDADRPLNLKGQGQVEALATYIQENPLPINLVLCSDAIRTQETLEGIRDVLPTSNMDVSHQYYNIGEDKILGYLREVEDAYDCLLYVGHNPGITFGAFKLSASPSDALGQGLDTCGLCGLQFDVDSWQDLCWHSGREILFWTPSSS